MLAKSRVEDLLVVQVAVLRLAVQLAILVVFRLVVVHLDHLALLLIVLEECLAHLVLIALQPFGLV